MFLMKGGGRINQGQGWCGCGGERRYIIPEEIRVLYRSVKLIRGHTKTTEALLQTIALAIRHPLGGSRWLELNVYVHPPASTTI